jgi:hypothetical protein
MDHLLIVTAAKKAHYVVRDSRGRMQIVRRERIVTSTGTQLPHPQQKRQQLYLSLAGPPVR